MTIELQPLLAFRGSREEDVSRRKRYEKFNLLHTTEIFKHLLYDVGQHRNYHGNANPVEAKTIILHSHLHVENTLKLLLSCSTNPS